MSAYAQVSKNQNMARGRDLELNDERSINSALLAEKLLSKMSSLDGMSPDTYTYSR